MYLIALFRSSVLSSCLKAPPPRLLTTLTSSRCLDFIEAFGAEIEPPAFSIEVASSTNIKLSKPRSLSLASIDTSERCRLATVATRPINQIESECNFPLLLSDVHFFRFVRVIPKSEQLRDASFACSGPRQLNIRKVQNLTRL